jgi:hypothetical protein
MGEIFCKTVIVDGIRQLIPGWVRPPHGTAGIDPERPLEIGPRTAGLRHIALERGARQMGREGTLVRRNPWDQRGKRRTAQFAAEPFHTRDPSVAGALPTTEGGAYTAEAPAVTRLPVSPPPDEQQQVGPSWEEFASPHHTLSLRPSVSAVANGAIARRLAGFTCEQRLAAEPRHLADDGARRSRQANCDNESRRVASEYMELMCLHCLASAGFVALPGR